MTDLLAHLDAAIDALTDGAVNAKDEKTAENLDRVRSSAAKTAENLNAVRNSHSSYQTFCPEKAPKPAENLESVRSVRSDRSKTDDLGINFSRLTTKRFDRESQEVGALSIIFSLVRTVSTDSIEDSCGFGSDQSHSRGSCCTDTIEEVRHFLWDLHGNSEENANPELPSRPLIDIPHHRWLQFLADTEAFGVDGWAAQGGALGWTVHDLAGCDADKPFARIDQQGLLWMLNGRRIVALTAETATIETSAGVRLTYRRKPAQPGQTLPWLLQ